MAAATEDIQLTQQDGLTIEVPVKASTTIYAGTLVCVDASGWAVPASDTANLRIVGFAAKRADNSTGSNGDISVSVSRRPGWVTNDGTNPVTAASLFGGAAAEVKDDNSVAVTAGTTNNIRAGLVLALDTTLGVLIDPTR